MTWKNVRLAECCEIKPPKSEAKKTLKESDLVSFVPMNSLGIDTPHLALEEDKALSEVTGSYTYFAENDVLLAKITPCFENGKLGIAKGLTNGVGFGSSEFIVFRTSDQLVPEYLYYYLLRPSFREQGQAVMTGAVGHKRVPKEFIEDTEIPLPHVEEQKRIVAILDQAFANIDKARALTEKNLKNTRELFESYLQQVFSQRENRWVKEKFGKVCKFVRGPFGGALKKNIFKPSGIAVYEQKHAIYDQFSEIRYFIDEDKFKEMERFELFPGDLIMSCSGTMGKIAIVPDAIEKGIINQALLKLTPEPSIDREFLKIWMQSKNFQAEIERRAQGAAIQNMASVKILKEIEMPLPSIDEQRKILELYKDIETQTGALFQLYQSKLVALGELEKSLLQKAFAGHLTKDSEEAAA